MNTTEGDYKLNSPQTGREDDASNKFGSFQDRNLDVRLLGSFAENPSREIREMDYDSFDTFFFYSLFICKKWLFIYPLYIDYIDFNKAKGIIASGRQVVMSQDYPLWKRILIIIGMIPIGIILAIYALLLLIIIVLLAIVAYISLILFIDLPFLITVSIQIVLLYLLICFPVEVTIQELSAAFLTTALWWVQLIWLLLFTLVMLQEIDDAMNSVIYITTYYHNKKLKKRVFIFYTIFSCFPQMVQLLITYVCASYASELIFNNIDYLTPFLHFAGLFLILKIDSFIMGILRTSFLYMPPVNAFYEIEGLEREERRKAQELKDKDKDNEIKEKVEEEKASKENKKESDSEDLVREENSEEREQKERDLEEKKEQDGQKGTLAIYKKYAWDRIHFTSRDIVRFFEIKMESEAPHFFFHNLQPTDPQFIGLVRLKLFLMLLGIFIIFAHLLKYGLMMICSCNDYGTF